MQTRADVLKARTKRFALDVLGLVDTFVTFGSTGRIGSQLCDAATSAAANYRAACRSRSSAEFAARIGVVLDEADEALLWLEIADERDIGAPAARQQLLAEANDLAAIFAASTITARATVKREREARRHR